MLLYGRPLGILRGPLIGCARWVLGPYGAEGVFPGPALVCRRPGVPGAAWSSLEIGGMAALIVRLRVSIDSLPLACDVTAPPMAAQRVAR